MRISPNNIEKIFADEIFVFGSNESGVHGAGAARTALKWGAKIGVPEGIQGNTYAIPTKDKTVLKTLSLEEIKIYVDRFLEFAKKNTHLKFLVTEIGCGLAGYNPKDVAPLFDSAKSMNNVWLPERFWH